MKPRHETRQKRVSEPVQVYLDRPDRARLERLAEEMRTTKSDVLRRALQALEHQLLDPDSHPALEMIGLAGDYKRTPTPRYDVVESHDRYIAEQEIASWKKPRKRKGG